MMKSQGWLSPTLALLIFFITLNVLILDIVNPAHPYFDEIRYISAARQMVAGGVNENWSHPPLGKRIIAFGIQIFGDNALGWRFMSAAFGAAILSLIYLWALTLTRKPVDAFLVTILTFLNQMHFVQSRIATLDVFMMAFVVLALFIYTWAWVNRPSGYRSWSLATLSGACFGLALACKWFAAVPLTVCFCLTSLSCRNGQKGRQLQKAIWAYIAVPLMVYLIICTMLLGMVHPNYAPALSSADSSAAQSVQSADLVTRDAGAVNYYALRNLMPMQIDMLKAQLNFNNVAHPYVSRWWTWPLMITPIWYDMTFETREGQRFLSGIFCVGNPLIFWVGFLAMIHCAFLWVRQRQRSAVEGFIALLFIAMWLGWAVIPRSTTFFYYYYPASMMLGFACARSARKFAALSRVGPAFVILCLLTFAYFYPLLVNQPLSERLFKLRILFPFWLM